MMQQKQKNQRQRQRQRSGLLGLALLLGVGASPPAQAREAVLGEVMWFAGSFCPKGWASADGQILEIASHTALFSLLGTAYGGDGRTTFGLPDLRGRTALHTGQGTGLSARPQGEQGGTESETLTLPQVPAHAVATLDAATADSSVTVLRRPPQGGAAPLSSTTVGEGKAHNNLPPYLVLRACIAVEGTYPTRP